jgi:hypothetical protein
LASAKDAATDGAEDGNRDGTVVPELVRQPAPLHTLKSNRDGLQSSSGNMRRRQLWCTISGSSSAIEGVATSEKTAAEVIAKSGADSQTSA